MSVKREILELAVAVVVVLLIYQGLSLAFGTSVPVTSVVSKSMQHSKGFDNWWNVKESEYAQFNITKEEFSSYIFHGGLYIGDMVVVIGTDEVKKGDILVYHPKEGCFPGISPKETIIHRVVSTTPLLTKGDNNDGPDVTNGNESCIQSIEGKAVLGLPLLGYPRLLLFQIFGV